MISFLFLVALFTFTFGLVNYETQIVHPGEKKKTYMQNLGAQYQIIFGENIEDPIKNEYAIQWLLYVLFTVLINIVLLNLLISIISDDYDRVQAQQKSTDQRAKCEILAAYGVLEFFVRKKILRQKLQQGAPMFVTRIVEASKSHTFVDESVNDTGEWTNRYDMLTKKQGAALQLIKDLDVKFEKQQADQKAMQAKFDKRFDE